MLKTLKRPEEALAVYDRALAIDPAFVEALIGRGNALVELKRYAEGLASLDAAVWRAIPTTWTRSAIARMPSSA